MVDTRFGWESRKIKESSLCYNLNGLEDRCFFDVAFVAKWGFNPGRCCESLQRDFNLDGLGDQCLFDVAFVTKWGST
jgi:hypothetical protein